MSQDVKRNLRSFSSVAMRKHASAGQAIDYHHRQVVSFDVPLPLQILHRPYYRTLIAESPNRKRLLKLLYGKETSINWMSTQPCIFSKLRTPSAYRTNSFNCLHNLKKHEPNYIRIQHHLFILCRSASIKRSGRGCRRFSKLKFSELIPMRSIMK